MNQVLVEEMLAHPELDLVDWDAYSEGHGDWFQTDNLHLMPAGGTGIATLLHAALASPLALPSQATLPAARRGAAYQARLAGPAGGSWRLLSGNLPSGLRLASTGTVSGSPQRAGTFEAEVLFRAADFQLAHQHVAIRVAAAPPATTVKTTAKQRQKARRPLVVVRRIACPSAAPLRAEATGAGTPRTACLHGRPTRRRILGSIPETGLARLDGAIREDAVAAPRKEVDSMRRITLLIVGCVAVAMLAAMPVAANNKPTTGTRIGLFAPPATFAANTPFYIEQGIGCDTAAGDKVSDCMNASTHFDLYLDGVLQRSTVDIDNSPGFYSKRNLTNYAGGLPAGSHTFVGVFVQNGATVLTLTGTITFA